MNQGGLKGRELMKMTKAHKVIMAAMPSPKGRGMLFGTLMKNVWGEPGCRRWEDISDRLDELISAKLVEIITVTSKTEQGVLYSYYTYRYRQTA